MIASPKSKVIVYNSRGERIYEAEFEMWADLGQLGKVEKILKGSQDSIPSPSPSVKIQIMAWKVCLRCKGKMLLGVVNEILKTKSLLTSPSNILPD